jgi:hypothetical protein
MSEQHQNSCRSKIMRMRSSSRLIPMKFQDSLHLWAAGFVCEETGEFHLHPGQPFRFEISQDERSLCRQQFSDNICQKYNKDGRKLNDNPTTDGRCYTPFPLPNTC